MKIIDRGSGPTVVVIPGIQGRWEWMAPAIDALARRCRVITFSLADEPSSQATFDEQRGFWCYVDQVREALDLVGVEKAAICGVSFGGLIAGAFVAQYPERVSSLVLVSALPPSWRPDCRVRFYLRAPRLLMPLFLLASLRLYREIAASRDGFIDGVAEALRHAWTALTHMLSPTRAARRIRLLSSADFREGLARVSRPTLLITGDPNLERVVPVSATLEYKRIWPHARVEMLARSGHLGLITRSEEFSRIVAAFAESHPAAPSQRASDL